MQKSQNNRNQGFSYCLCLMIEGSESVPLITGSRWPKNIRILRIRIHRIRILNTAKRLEEDLNSSDQSRKVWL
jgi:hypothetical protein